MPKPLSTHHCAGSKRLSLQTFRIYLSFKYPTILSLIFTHAANLSIWLSGSIKASNCSTCFSVHISLYTWCLLIKVLRSKAVIRRLEVHLASKLFLLSSWKRIYRYTTCKRATIDSFYRTKLCNGMVSSLFQNIIRMFWFECSFGWKFLFVESYLQDSCWIIIMATIASKCKLNTKFIKDKYSALKEVEDGKTKS